MIAPSLLAANKEKLADEIKLVDSLHAEYLHWDIMDGKFVATPVALTSEQLKKHARIHSMVNDVHIMVADPLNVSQEFIKAGANIVTFHIEATHYDEKETLEVIDKIHELECAAGISIKPCSSVGDIEKYLDKVELVLVMSVEPGKGGQKFMPEALSKIAELKRIRDEKGLKFLIEVDGGINGETGQECLEAGCDILVAGSYLFGHDDIKERMETLR
ncbi:MAG: ribulose-phosphate 3-epimerase [Bacilli bacterium]|nr:ribulose-phosphate 3-epimerase [Bacilli bacterium]